MKNILIILFLTIFNIGCTTTYQYESSSLKLDKNVFKVSFEGKRNMNLKDAEEIVLLKASDITIDNGYAYFEIVENNTTFNQKTYNRRTPVMINHWIWHPYGFYNNGFNSVIFQNENETVSRPYITYIIKLHKENKNNNALYNAKIIKNELNK